MSNAARETVISNGVNLYTVLRPYAVLRTDSCDEQRIYKSGDISGPEGGKYMLNTSPKSSDFFLSNDVW